MPHRYQKRPTAPATTAPARENSKLPSPAPYVFVLFGINKAWPDVAAVVDCVFLTGKISVPQSIEIIFLKKSKKIIYPRWGWNPGRPPWWAATITITLLDLCCRKVINIFIFDFFVKERNQGINGVI